MSGKVRILKGGSSLYINPDAKAEKVAFFPEGLVVNAIEQVGDFFRVESFGAIGYVPKWAAEVVGSSVPKVRPPLDKVTPHKPVQPQEQHEMAEQKPSQDYRYEGIWPLHQGWRAFLLLTWFLLTPLIGIGVGLWRLIAGTRTTAWGRAGFLGITLLVFTVSSAVIGVVVGMSIGDDGIHQEDVDAASSAAYQQGQYVGYADGERKGYSDGLNEGKKTMCWTFADSFVKAGNRAGPAMADYCEKGFGSR